MDIPHSRLLIDESDIKAVTDVLASGHIAQGRKTRDFEGEFASFVGTKFATAVSSGTAAIHLALASLGVGRGDEVIMPSYVCTSPYMAALHAGAVPIIADIGNSDFNLDLESVKNRITPRTKALIVPHMFGCPVDIDPFLELGIPLIEDCAQSAGAEYRGRRVGSMGRVSVFSFYATKIMTTGEGGMVMTNDPEINDQLKALRDYDGRSLDVVRYNYKMTDMEAALGLSQLKRLPDFIRRRKQIARTYNNRLSSYNLSLQFQAPHKNSVHYRYVLLCEKMEQLRGHMRKRGVSCEKPVSVPLHFSFPNIRCPNTDFVYGRAISIPLYPALSDDEVDYVMDSLELGLITIF
ncbi:MAG: DegT/DnrJ/EryC1/StrS family aminotransferase [Candidatus Methanomethylicus sp.]|nr:DegT/DnrJ/EryC1/StrS family aminotransferase [Candidatus Methanomethylicus sp.]